MPSLQSYSRGGEKMADFEEIYIEHFHNVYKYVFSLCRNEKTAEEITQEAFYKAMEHLDSFDGRCKLYVWLCQIAKNTYLTFAKKQKRLISESGTDLYGQSQSDFESELVDKDTAWEVHTLLHRLKEPYKEVFSLRVFGELSFSQIGELFGKTDSWARLIFYRAKQEIRRGLDERTL